MPAIRWVFPNPVTYIYVYVQCVVFSMVHSRARLRIPLTARQTAYFSQVAVAMTNATDSSIAHTPQKEKKKKKKEARLEVRII